MPPCGARRPSRRLGALGRHHAMDGHAGAGDEPLGAAGLGSSTPFAPNLFPCAFTLFSKLVYDPIRSPVCLLFRTTDMLIPAHVVNQTALGTNYSMFTSVFHPNMPSEVGAPYVLQSPGSTQNRSNVSVLPI